MMDNLNFRDDLNKVGFPVGLAVRSGDVFDLNRWDGAYNLNEPTYAVALFLAPSLFDLGVATSDVATPTGVVAAGLTEDGWGWIQLETHTKDYIGDMLRNIGAKPNEWFRLTITYENPLKEAIQVE